MNHSFKNIKQRLDQHEFDFNPRSWDNMEVLLEGEAPSKKSYFKTKTIFIMITVLMLLAYLFWQEPSPPLADFYTPQLTDTDFPSQQNLTDQPLHEPTNRNQQTAAKNQQLIIENQPFKDTSFFQTLTQKINVYNRHYAAEKVYLQFDRTFFEPGESIWFNAFLRQANSLRDLPKSKILYVELIAPNGSVANKITLLLKNGRSAGDFKLDKTAPGGMYKIRAYTNWQRNTKDAFERELQVQASVLPRLRMEMDFQREAYGPGDVVTASVDLQSLANEPLANHAYTAKASLAGESFQEIKGTTDDQGMALVKILMPKSLATSDGLLNVLIEYNGQVESISRSIPIVLNKIDLQFMPEGGDPVVGIAGKVAFKALNEFGKPADVEGEISDLEGNKITTFRSYHQGMGSFEMVPESGKQYQAHLTKPAGISTTYPLPVAHARGYAISVSHLDQEELRVEVNSTENEKLYLVLVSSGEIYFTQILPADAGSHLIKIPTKTLPIGTAQVTLFDSKQIPRAERLVFLNPHKRLNVEITTDKEKYLPREKVEMTVKVTDERGMPMPGQFALSVADDNLLTFADDKQGHILSHFLLESELQGEVVEPDFYFDKKDKHPEKDQLLALDYLMLTQGWRRFDWSQVLWQQPIAMTYEAEDAKLKGQLLDAYRKPLPGMEVTLGKSDMVAITDEDGVFVMDTIVGFLPRFQVSFYSDPDRQVWYRGKLENGKLILPTRVDPGHYADQSELTGEEGEGKPSMKFDKELDYSELPVAEQKTGQVPIGAEGMKLVGSVKDVLNGGPIILGGVSVIKNGEIVSWAKTDYEGNFIIDGLEPGVYDLGLTRRGYHSLLISNIPITPGMANNIAAKLDPNFQMEEIVVIAEKNIERRYNRTYSRVITEAEDSSPKTKKKRKKKDRKRNKKSHEPNQGQASSIGFGGLDQKLSDRQREKKKVTKEDVKNLPTRNVDALASTPAGAKVKDDDSQINIRGSRTDATNFYIDGVKTSDKRRPAQMEEEVETEDGGQNESYLVGQYQKDVRKNMREQTPEQKQNGETLRSAKSKVKRRYGGSAIGINLYAPRQFYAPRYDASSSQPTTSIQRTDFRKTVFWKPNLTADRNGVAKVEFYNTDAITTFRATVEGLGMDGSIGHGTQRFYTQLPFGMDVKIPANLLTGDRLVLPLTLMNHTDQPLEGTREINTPSHFLLEKQLPATVSLPAGETKTIYPSYKIDFRAKTGELSVNFVAAGQQDALVEHINVQPRGFPVHRVFGGNQLSQTFVVEVNDPVEGSLEAAFTAHPTVLSELTSGLEKMIRQPRGCFEQTSSGNYPNVLVMNFLRKTGQANPGLEQRARAHLKHGYERLKTFEVKNGGFDWYGKPPAHEALTAYGLMQFVDMEKVYPVEPSLINRTANWLLTRRDGQGGWDNGRKGLHSWKQKSDIADAYITWTLTEAGYGERVDREVEKTLGDANTSQDPYLMALAANILVNRSDERAGQLLAQLAQLQAEDGSWTGLTHSMTHSRGKNLTVETTSLAALAFLKVPALQIAEDGKWSSEQIIKKAVDYLATAKTHYGFGSTQATVLALKALVKHAENAMAEAAVGPVAVFVNGQKAAEQAIRAGQTEPIVFTGLSDYFTEGKNEVKVEFADRKKALPYDLSVQYSTHQPPSDPHCALDLKIQLTGSGSPSVFRMGETIRLTTTITNKQVETVSNPIAIVGLPAGLGVQPWQVKEMQEQNLFDFYEINDGYVVFYFRHLEGKETRHIHLDLKAEIPGTFEAPASSAYLYYENDVVVWDRLEELEVEN